MKIRLFLAITFILSSITSGIEIFGTDEEFNINNNEEEKSGDDIHNKYLNPPFTNHIENKLFYGKLRKKKNKDINDGFGGVLRMPCRGYYHSL